MKIIHTSILLFSILCFESQSEQEHISVMHGVERVREGISLGYDINGLNSFGDTPLMNAAFWGRRAEAEVLINAGADVNYRDKHGSTALQIAAYRANLDFVKLLVKSGASVNSADKFQTTPLYTAAINGRTEIVIYLVDNGADLNRVSIFGTTILNGIRTAKEKLLNYKQIERILVENGAKDISSPVGNQLSMEEVYAILGGNSHISTEVQTNEHNQAKSNCADSIEPLEYRESESCNKLQNESESR